MGYNQEDHGSGKEEKEEITVLVVEPMEKPYVKTIDGGLRSLQSEVDGHIEAIFPFDDPVSIVLNSDGKFQGLTWNRGLFDREGELCDIIAGTFLVVGVKGENFVSLSEELTARYMEKYRIPEQFICRNGQYLMIPIECAKGTGPAARPDNEPAKEERNKKDGTRKQPKKCRAYEER